MWIPTHRNQYNSPGAPTAPPFCRWKSSTSLVNCFSAPFLPLSFFFFFIVFALGFFHPIQKAMAQRTALIEGARAEAAAVEAPAKKELDTYNEALRRPAPRFTPSRKPRVKPFWKSAHSFSKQCAAARKKR